MKITEEDGKTRAIILGAVCYISAIVLCNVTWGEGIIVNFPLN